MNSSPDVRHGSRQPRVRSVPAYASSAGSEAVELAASAGLVLDGWQQDVLTAALGERPDGRWSASQVGLIVPRQNGKGSILEARELFGLVVGKEELILHSAHLFPTSLEAYRRIRRLFEETPDLKRLVKKFNDGNDNRGIEMRNGCRLKFVARSKGGGRGMSGDVVILDEAFALTEDQLEALMPTMSARPNPQIWYTSSPPLDAVTGAPLFNLKARAEAGAPGLAWFDWSTEPGADIDDEAVWAAANPAYGIRISRDFVEKERQALTAEGFSRERLGMWPETVGTAVISSEMWAGLADRDAERPADVAFAVDVTPMRDHAAIAMAGIRPDGALQLSVVDHRPGTDWIPERLATLNERWDPVCIALDGKGPASSILLDLREAGLTVSDDLQRPQRGDLVLLGASDASTAWGMFVDAAKQGRTRHSDEPALNLALAGAKTRPLGDGSAWARRGNTDISPLVAATMAHWAYQTFAQVVVRELEPAAYYL